MAKYGCRSGKLWIEVYEKDSVTVSWKDLRGCAN